MRANNIHDEMNCFLLSFYRKMFYFNNDKS